MRFQDKPIGLKLTAIILGTSAVVLLLTCTAFLAYDVFAFRKDSVRQLSTLGEIVATNSTGVLAFANQDDATEILAALRAERHIVAACLYDRQGRIFARYPAGTCPTKPSPQRRRRTGTISRAAIWSALPLSSRCWASASEPFTSSRTWPPSTTACASMQASPSL